MQSEEACGEAAGGPEARRGEIRDAPVDDDSLVAAIGSAGWRRRTRGGSSSSSSGSVVLVYASWASAARSMSTVTLGCSRSLGTRCSIYNAIVDRIETGKVGPNRAQTFSSPKRQKKRLEVVTNRRQ
jgi:hypothetical protein